MKVIPKAVLWSVIMLVSCGNESVNTYDSTRPSDPLDVQESTQGAIVRPDAGPPPPHPDLTAEESDRLLRLKGKNSPWETDADFLQAPDETSKEKLPNTPASIE